MALATIGVPQHGRGAFLTGQGRGLGLDHRHGITIGALRTFGTIAPVIAFIAIPAGPFVPGALIAGALVTGTIIPRPVVARPLVPRSFVPRSFVSGPIVPGAVVSIAIFPRRTFIARTIIPGLIIAGSVIPLTPAIAPATIVVVEVPVAVAVTIIAVVAIAPGIAVPGFCLRLFLTLGLRLGRIGRRSGLGSALVFEIDVEAGGKRIAAQYLRGGTLGLHGPHDPEIVLCVLQVVLSQNPVTGRCRIPCQLLVFFEDVLGVTANLDAVGAIGLESPIGVLRLRFAATTAAAIAAALTLHTLEISHSLLTVPPALHLSGNARA